VAAASSQDFSELAGFCDGVEPTTEAEYAQRRAAVQAKLQRSSIDALVIEPGPNMLYLSGIRWGRSERPFLMVVPADGEPRWICPAFEVRRAREQLGEGADVVAWAEHDDPFRELAHGASVRVDPDARGTILAGVRERVGKGAQLDAGVIESVRLRKSAAELARLRRVNEATKAALAVAGRRATPGMRQSELADAIGEAQRIAGLQDVWVLCLFGPAAAFPHGTREDRVLEDGDLVLVDTGGALHGYRSDITRTWAVGSPRPDAKRAWQTVAEAQAAGLAAIRPGAKCGDPDAAARAVMKDAGYGADYETFTHRLGHGIGLQVHEAPYLVRDNERILEPGMTMSDEPGIYVPGSFGVRIEDIVAVTETGAEVFGPSVGPFEDPMRDHAPA
jgi:Xaa-Pro dipeptidase